MTTTKRLQKLNRRIPTERPRRQPQRRLLLEPLEDRRLLSLLGVAPTFPVITFDQTGVLTYDPSSHRLDITATPISYKQTSSSPARTISDGRDLEVHLLVDNNGVFMAGNGAGGNDLLITGAIDLNGNGAIDPGEQGTLLTGKASQFGFLEAGTTDNYDFRFTPTGGILQQFYAGKDIGLKVSSEISTFNGSDPTKGFHVSFSGGKSVV